jgi:hypothetical protein
MTIVIVLVVLLTIISSVIAARPAQFRIERNASIPAPLEGPAENPSH